MNPKSDNIEIKINYKADEVIEKLFKSLLNRYQDYLETSMRVCDFIFDCVHLAFYKCHEINPNGCGSCIDSSDWMKDKKTAINLVNKNDNKCFRYTVTKNALNHE